MKRELLLNTLTLMLPAMMLVGSANAQFLTLEDHGGSVVNGTQITAWVENSETFGKVELDATLNLPQGTTVGVKRYELSVDPATRNYFCWALCYLDWPAGQYPFFDAPDQQFIQTGATFSGFAAYHMPEGTNSCNLYRYVWYDNANPSDTTWVDIEFCSTPVSVENLPQLTDGFELTPNPSSGQDVTISVPALAGINDARLIVHDALGARVLSSGLNGPVGLVRVPASELEQGIYFCSIEVSGNVIGTQRLVVTGR